MSDDFDIEKFAAELSEKHPELTEKLENEESNEQFETDEFERNLVDEWPKLAEEICELDEQICRDEEGKSVSKKQQARERQERLEAMMMEGRSVVEQKAPTFHETILKIEGPMSLLAEAVKSEKRIHVRTRCAVRIDRIFEGIPVTFDEHFNMMMRDVTETVLHGRKSQKEVGNRNRLRSFLPEFLKWREGGEWPMPIGGNRLLEHRVQRACFIKGDSIVLVQIL